MKFFIVGSAWVGFDDVEVVKIKVSYAKQKKLLGYFVRQVPYDDNWELSLAGKKCSSLDNLFDVKIILLECLSNCPRN